MIYRRPSEPSIRQNRYEYGGKNEIIVIRIMASELFRRQWLIRGFSQQINTDSTDFIRNAISHDSLCDTKGTYGRMARVECNIAELIVMTRYFHLLETRNRFANGDLWQDVLAVLLLACAGTAA